MIAAWRPPGPTAPLEIEAAGGQLWLRPPYSPDLNPIEKMWSTIKAFRRAAQARCTEGLDHAVAAGLEKAAPQDARGGWNLADIATAPPRHDFRIDAG